MLVMMGMVLGGALSMAACGAALWHVLDTWHRARDSASWPSTMGTFERALRPSPVHGMMRATGLSPTLRYVFVVDGTSYTGRRMAFGFPRRLDLRGIRTPMASGAEVEISYDPEDPRQSTLVRGPIAEATMIRVMLSLSLALAASACLIALGVLSAEVSIPSFL